MDASRGGPKGVSHCDDRKGGHKRKKRNHRNGMTFPGKHLKELPNEKTRKRRDTVIGEGKRAEEKGGVSESESDKTLMTG